MTDAMAGGGALSFNPTDAVAGGTLIDDCEATLVSLRAQLYDYNGKIPAPIVALHGIWQYLVDGQPQVAHEYYSVGDPKNFAPSVDGRQIVPVGTQVGLTDSCNAYKLMVSFINGGFQGSIGKDLGVFDGSRCYVKRVAQPKVQGAEKQSRPLLVQKYLGVGQVLPMAHTAQAAPAVQGFGANMPQMGGGMPAGFGAPTAAPGFAPMGGAAPAGFPGMGQTPGMVPQGFNPAAVAAQAPAAAPAGFGGFQAPQAAPMQAQAPAPAPQAMGAPGVSPEVMNKAAGYLHALLQQNGGTLPKAQIAAKAFTALANDPDRNVLVQLMFTDGFLATPGAPWKFDGQTVSL